MASPTINFADFLDAGGTQAHIDEITARLTERRKEVAEKFPVRWAVQIGTHATMQELLASIEARGATIDNSVRALLSRMSIATAPRVLQVVTPRVVDLGFTYMASPPEIAARAKVQGLVLCPSEAALHICGQYIDQPGQTRLLMMTEGVVDSNGLPVAFGIEHVCGIRRVVAYDYWSRIRCHLDVPLAFVIP